MVPAGSTGTRSGFSPASSTLSSGTIALLRPLQLNAERLAVAYEVTVNGVPLRFFHFSGYDFRRPELISKFQNRHTFKDRPDVAPLFRLYAESIGRPAIGSVRRDEACAVPAEGSQHTVPALWIDAGPCRSCGWLVARPVAQPTSDGLLQ